MGDLCTVWETVSVMLSLQHSAIRDLFQKSIYVHEHRHNVMLYTNLRGFVSRHALGLIFDESERVKYVGIDKSACGCIMRTCHGLPCACELGRYIMMPAAIPLDAIHVFWKMLFFENDRYSQATELSLKPEWEMLVRRFEALEVPGKVDLKSKVRQLACPETTTLLPPPIKVKTKGAPKKKGKLKVSKNEESTKREPSLWERVDSFLGCNGKKVIGLNRRCTR